MLSRCLLLLEVDRDPSAAAAALAHLAGQPERVHALALLTGPGRSWLQRLLHPAPELPDWSLRSLRLALQGAGREVSVEVAWELDLDGLAQAAAELEADALVLASPGFLHHVHELQDLARRLGLPVLRLGELPQTPAPAPAREGSPSRSEEAEDAQEAPPDPPQTGRLALLPYQGRARPLARAVTALRPLLRPADELALLALGVPDPRLARLGGGQLVGSEGPSSEDPPSADGSPEDGSPEDGAPQDRVDDLPALAELIDLPCSVTSGSLPGADARLFAEHLARRPVDLVVLVPEAFDALTQLGARWLGTDVLDGSPAVLVLPPAPHPQPADALEAPDVLLVAGRVQLAAAARGLLGSRPLDQPLQVFARGQLLASLDLAQGPAELELPPALRGDPPGHLALARGEGGLGTVERAVRLLDPGERPLLLLDGDLPPARLAAAVTRWPGALALVLAPHPGEWTRLRGRLAAAGLDLPVLDPGALLDDGDPGDVPWDARALRLLRVGHFLRAAGLRVAGLVHRPAPVALDGGGRFLVQAAGEEEAPPEAAGPGSPPLSPDPFFERTCAPAREGNSIAVEVDNAGARRRLLELLAGAEDEVGYQAYIVHDDPLAREVAQALIAAGRRGVRVRILVDSLWTLHGSFGRSNTLLADLERAPGVEVRALRPVRGLPTLVDLKRRGHRKLLLVDGRLAQVSGRNLAASYYTGLGEVALRPETPADEVPWLDAGAEVRGPLVEDVGLAFRAQWLEAGGEPFPVHPVPPAGSSRARLVVHEGLGDARTIDAYRHLIGAARRRLTIVNTFPLAKELEHALLRAQAAGVEVRLLLGSVRPKRGPEQEPFPAGNPLREVGHQLVRAHVEPLVEAGVHVAELRLEGLPAWAEGLGPVWPHIHAKLLVADGEVCSVGSPNLDVASSYWESETLLVVEDPAVAGPLEEQLEELLQGSTRLRADDPRWQQEAARRVWWTRAWPQHAM